MAPRRDSQAAIFAYEMEGFEAEVVAPVLAKLVPSPSALRGGPRKTVVQTARDNGHNALCYTARLSFALTVGASFERNLRSWLGRAAADQREVIHRAARPALLRWLGDLKGLDLDQAGLEADLSELWEVTAMARHGDGPAADRVAAKNPSLWAHNDPHLQSLYDADGQRADTARVSDEDLARYFRAVIGFWRLAERTRPPGRG